MAAACEHVGEVRADWPPLEDPACDECTDGSWVSLRRCLTCGHVGCCDSSPGLHATAHHKETGHPMVQTLQPGQDWAWCYVDELSFRPENGGWIEVDLFFEAGLAYMREHVDAGGDPNPGEDFIYGKGFPLGEWVKAMRERDLTGDQREQVEALGVSLGGG